MIRTKRQSGFALLLVMILLAMLVVMGLSYVSSAAIANVAATHHGQMVQARYLAESGLEHARFLLREHPDMLDGSDRRSLGPYSPAGVSGSYRLSASALAETGQYMLSAEADSGVSTQRCRALVYRPAGQAGPVVSYSMLVGQGMTFVPSGVTLNGPSHVNGHLFNFGVIRGQTTATGSILNLGSISPAPQAGQSSVELPEFNAADYQRYIYDGQIGESARFDDWQLRRQEDICNGGAIAINNPAGVVTARPGAYPLVVYNNVSFEGTLIVEGDVILYGENVNLAAEEGLPALIVTGAIYVYRNSSTNIAGVVYAREGIWPYGDSSGSRLTVDGALVCEYGGFGLSLGGRQTINFDEGRSRLIDPTGQLGPSDPIEILRWEE